MSRLTPFPIAGGSYKDDTLPWSAQDTVNWLPVAAEKPGTTSPMLLRGVPGLQTVVASGQSAGLPVRGGYDADGFCVVVIGQSLYRFDGQATTLLGTVPGIQRVQFAHNQVAGGVQIAIATGTGGYVYDTAAQTLAQITDDGFPGAKSLAYMDSYIIGVDPTGNFWFNSDLADATSYNTLNRYEAESEPDRIQTLLVSHEDVVIFGARTTEFWYDSGANINTFQRRDGTGFEIGCVSPHAAVNLDNTVYWRGHDGSAYRLDGYTAHRISTGPIEQDWAKSDPSQCFAMTFVDRGHKIVYWTQPDGKTWGYDVATGEWHRRASHLMDRWRANCLFQHQRIWYAGDYTNGSIHRLGWGVNKEGKAPLIAERTTTVMQDDRNRFRFNAVEILMDAQSSAPNPFLTPQISIKGDMPDGGTGDLVNTPYVISNGFGPYTYSIDSGALPPGVTFDDATGIASGSYTTVGDYSWSVKGVDINGDTAVVGDSATVKQTYLVGANGFNLAYSQTGESGWVLASGIAANWVAFGNGVFVGLAGSTLYTSTNLTAWTTGTPPASGTPKGGLAFGSGVFVTGTAPGGLDAGHLYSSPNGTNWTAITHPSIRSVHFVAYLNGLFLVGDFSGSLLTSTDGVAWTKYTLASWGLAATVSPDGVYMVAGNKGATYTSPDGKAWTLQSTQFGSSASIVYLGYFDNKYLAVINASGGLYSSTDGKVWAPVTAPAVADGAVVTHGADFFSAYTGGVMYTPDLSAWTQVSTGLSSPALSFCVGRV